MIDMELAKALGSASAATILAVALLTSWAIIVVLWVKLWKVQDDLNAALKAQISNMNQRTVVDQGSNALMIEVLKTARRSPP